MRLHFILATLLVAITCSAQTIWHVSPTGTGNGTSAATPLGSIQAAINAAASGDIVELASGTYSGPQFYNNTCTGKSLTVRGAPNAPKPVIDGLGQNHFFIECGSSPVIKITNMSVTAFVRPSSPFGAIRSHQVGNFAISDTDVSNCVTSGFGAALYADATTDVSVQRCTFTSNSSIAGPNGTGYGGAICFMQAGINGGEASISDSTFISNTSADHAGAVMATGGSSLKINRCSFVGNTANSNGGAVFSDKTMTCVDSSFENNHATGSNSLGGSAFLDHDPAVVGNTLERCRFAGGSAFRGGGVFADSVNVLSCDFDGNAASERGGGAYLVAFTQTSIGHIRSSVFRRNSSGGNGGGLFRSGGFPGMATACCTFVFNASDASGSAFMSSSGCYPYADVSNCIIFGNRYGGSPNHQVSGSQQDVRYCLVELMSSINSCGSPIGSVESNPGLPIDGSSFHLFASSPAIGIGNLAYISAGWKDVDGQDRVIGGALDCGADEFGPMEIEAANVAQIGAGWILGVRTYPPLPYTPYAVDLSVTGTSPGIQIGLGQVAPLNPPLLNFDYGVYLSVPYPNIFQNFIGLTDANGRADAIFNVPDVPALIGLNVWGAGCVLDATSPTGIGPISAPVQTLVKDHLPIISAVSPSTAPIAGGAPITITGDYLQPGATVTFGGVAATNVNVVPPNFMTCTAPAHALGLVDIVVTNPDSQIVSLVGGFTYIDNLSVSSVTPLVPTAGATVTVTGQGFQQGAVVSVGALNLAPISVSASTVTFAMPAGALCGAALTITNPSTQTATLPFNPSPTINFLTGNVGPAAGGQVFTITGGNLHAGTTVTVSGNAAVINAIAPTQLDVTAPAGNPGTATIVVASSYGCSATANYYYLGPVASLTSVTLNQGPIAGGTNITVSGTNFLAGAAVKIDGVGCSNINVVNGTTITCTTPAGTLGPKIVLLINGDTQQTLLPGGFTYIPNVAINSVTHPSMAPGATVSVAGAGFLAGLTLTACGVPVSPVGLNSTSLTFVMPAGLACSGQLVVTNPTGQSASVLFNPSPIVVGLVLANGPLVGGNSFVIQGRWFYPGTTVTVGGNPATISSMTPGTATTLGSIVVIAPPSASTGPKPVIVTSPTGCTNSATFNYTYN